MDKKKSYLTWIAMIAGALLTALGVGFWFVRRRRKAKQAEEAEARRIPVQLSRMGETGLSEANAARLQTNQRVEESRKLNQQQLKQTLKASTLSVFNLTMLVLAFTLLWLDDPLGFLTTLGVLLLNIGINTFQQIFAEKMVEKAAVQAQAYATVIRSGKLRSVDLNQVVVGDVLAAGQGDEILASGELLAVHNLVLVNPADPVTTLPAEVGDSIPAGSVCLQGQVVYRIDEIPPVQTFKNNDEMKNRKTPLEKILQRILIFLLTTCSLFYMLFLLEVLRIGVLSIDQLQLYRDVMSIILSLVPSGFFLIVIINYAMGAIDLTRQGALIRDNRAIELLAQLNSLIFIRSQGLTDITARVEMIPNESGEPVFSETFVRRMLGDIARSVHSGHDIPLILKDSFEGERIELADEAFFLSLYGWGGVTITTPERRGTYIIGETEILRPYLTKSRKSLYKRLVKRRDDGEEESRGFLKRVGGLFRRNGNKVEDENIPVKTKQQPAPVSAQPTPGNYPNTAETNPEESEAEEQAKGLVGFLKKSAMRVAGFIDEIQDLPEPVESSDEDLVTMMMAYNPEPMMLYQSNQLPSCPSGLIPIGHLCFTRAVQPELAEIIQRFKEGGVQIRFFTEWLSKDVLEKAQEYGLVNEGEGKLAVLTASELEGALQNQGTAGTEPATSGKDKKVMGTHLAIRDTESQALPIVVPSEVQKIKTTQIDWNQEAGEKATRAIQDATIYQGLNADQKAFVIRTLRQVKEYVGMVGSSVVDWKTMNSANLSIARKSSDQAVMTNANIVLMKDSPPPLNPVLERGQQIVHSTMDVIKLNLLPLSYILLLLAVMFVQHRDVFVYNATQGGIIAFFTVVVPSVAMSFWARKGSVGPETMGKQLVFFIIPPALIITIGTVISTQFFFVQAGGIPSMQNGNTHYLIAIGLLVAVFVKPPVSWLAGGARVARFLNNNAKGKPSDDGDPKEEGTANMDLRYRRDFRVVYTAGGLWVLFNLVILIPLAQDLMKIKPLDSAWEYGFVVIAAVLSGVLMQVVWRVVRYFLKLDF